MKRFLAKTISLYAVAIIFTVSPPDKRLLLSLPVFSRLQWSLVVFSSRLCGNYCYTRRSSGVLRRLAAFRNFRSVTDPQGTDRS